VIEHADFFVDDLHVTPFLQIVKRVSHGWTLAPRERSKIGEVFDEKNHSSVEGPCLPRNVESGRTGETEQPSRDDRVDGD